MNVLISVPQPSYYLVQFLTENINVSLRYWGYFDVVVYAPTDTVQPLHSLQVISHTWRIPTKKRTHTCTCMHIPFTRRLNVSLIA